jgi:hypothetical protein
MPAFLHFRNPQRSAATPVGAKTLRPWPEPQATLSEQTRLMPIGLFFIQRWLFIFFNQPFFGKPTPNNYTIYSTTHHLITR